MTILTIFFQDLLMTAHRPGRVVVLALALLLPQALSAQSAPADRLTQRDELLAADRAVSDSVLRLGFREGLARTAAADLALLYPGAPVIAGQEAVHSFLQAQEVLKGMVIRWVPLYAEVSADGGFGVSYGVTGIATRGAEGAPPLRFGKYLSAWRHTPAGWRLVAHVQVGLSRPQDAKLADGFAPPVLSPIPKSGSVAAFADADSRFAAQAGHENAAAAFAAFAAEDAVTFPPTGELTRGPAEIRRAFTEEGPPSTWRWHPVIAGGGAAGDLGYTIGEAVIEGQGPDGKAATFHTKYLTLWRKDAGGNIRFIADGGNALPAKKQG